MLQRRVPNSHNQETEKRFKKHNHERTHCKIFNRDIW